MISTVWSGPTKCTRYAFLMSWENSRKLKFRNCPQSILVDTIMSNFLIHLFYSSNEVGNRMLKFTLSLTIHFDITLPWKWLLSPLLLGSWDRSGPRSLWSKRSRSRSSQKPRLVPSLVPTQPLPSSFQLQITFLSSTSSIDWELTKGLPPATGPYITRALWTCQKTLEIFKIRIWSCYIW